MDMNSGRRDFLRLGAGLGAAVALGGDGRTAGGLVAGELASVGAKPIESVRVGFVGVGVKGSEHVANLLRIDGVELRAVCDIREDACASARRMAAVLGSRREPAAYTRGERDFERMCAAEGLDL